MLSSFLWWPPTDCSWSLAEGGKEGHWLTGQRDSAASLVTTSPQHHPFKVGPLTPTVLYLSQKCLPLAPPVQPPIHCGTIPSTRSGQPQLTQTTWEQGQALRGEGCSRIPLELEVPLKLSRVDSLGKGTGATSLGIRVSKESSSCLQSPILLSYGGAAKQVAPRA